MSQQTYKINFEDGLLPGYPRCFVQALGLTNTKVTASGIRSVWVRTTPQPVRLDAFLGPWPQWIFAEQDDPRPPLPTSSQPLLHSGRLLSAEPSTRYANFRHICSPAATWPLDPRRHCAPSSCFALSIFEDDRFHQTVRRDTGSSTAKTPSADLIVSASTGVAGGRATATLTVTGVAHRSGVLRFQNVGGAEPVSLAIYRFKAGQTDALQCARIGTPLVRIRTACCSPPGRRCTSPRSTPCPCPTRSRRATTCLPTRSRTRTFTSTTLNMAD